MPPADKVLPALSAWNNEDPVAGAVLDAAAETVFASDSPTDELYIARVRLAERRMAEALLALEQVYVYELAAYRAIMQAEPT